MKQFNRFMALAAFTALHVFGQDISGEWQGSLKAGPQEPGSSCKSQERQRNMDGEPAEH